MDEFEIYCANKSNQAKEVLLPVRGMIQSAAPDAQESRVHFYLVYHLGTATVVKLDIGAKEIARLTFVNGSELNDPTKLLKGKSLARTISVKNDEWLAKNTDSLVDLISQSYNMMKARWDGQTQMTVLRPDQPSP